MMIAGAIRKKMVQALGLVLMVGSSLGASNSFWFEVDNESVYNVLNLAAPLEQCFFPIPLGGNYCLWNNDWKLPRYGSISFTAKATNDIHIGISKINPSLVGPSGTPYTELVSSNNLYEVVIGGWSNTRTVIRKGRQGQEIAAAEGSGIPRNSETGLGVDALVKYKVILYQHRRNYKNMIAVYYCYPGNTEWIRLICCEDPNFITASQRWFSFSNWDNPALYQSIKVSDATDLPETRDDIMLSELQAD